jgi:HK97 family phage portal protein
MGWRERLANIVFSRAAAVTSPASVEGGGGATGGAPSAVPPSPLSTLPPWGNQWPTYTGRYYPENLSVVCACVSAIAGGIASLPAAVYQTLPDGKRVRRDDHPVSRIIRQPNHLQSWPDFLEWLLASTLLQGNAIAVVDHDGAGRPCGLYPIPWWCCQPILVPAAPAEAIGSPYVPNSKLVFDVTQTMMPWPLPGGYSATGFPRRYFDDEVVFLRDRSDDGILGRSRLSRAPEAYAAGLGAQSFSTGIWLNGAMPSGVLKHPGRLSAEAMINVAQSWRDSYSGGPNAGKTAVLEEAMEYERIGVSPEDAELLDSRRFSVEELCRLFNVPPPIIGEWTHATFSNTASASEWFGSMTLLPWVRKIEREFSRTVFNTDDCELVVDMAGLLRGSYQDLLSSNIAAVRAGVMSADEARAPIGLDPRGGEANELRPQAVGGRPAGSEDEPDSSAKLNGNRPPGIRPAGNGSTTLQ